MAVTSGDTSATSRDTHCGTILRHLGDNLVTHRATCTCRHMYNMYMCMSHVHVHVHVTCGHARAFVLIRRLSPLRENELTHIPSVDPPYEISDSSCDISVTSRDKLVTVR